MKSLSESHPVVTALYFLSVTGIAMFLQHPGITACSLLGAMLLFLLRNGAREGKSHLWFLGLFAVMALVNPLVSHNGATVLLVINHNPITLEALLYGISMSASLLAVLYWFRSFSQIMTRDKLLCVFGKLSPKLALILSMALRYAALFSAQTRRVVQTQKALGLYREDHILARLRGGVRIFSVMLTWALENGITTADSMSARGYGIGKRTQFSVYRFYWKDAVLLGLCILLVLLVLSGAAAGSLEFHYYPTIHSGVQDVWQSISLASFGLLALLPGILEIKEKIKWNCCLSKI